MPTTPTPARAITTARAIVRFTRTHIVVLCPRGHLITARKNDRDFAGSMFEAELGAHAAGRPNTFDRAATDCAGQGCPGSGD